MRECSFHRNPKRQQGAFVNPSLTLRVMIRHMRIRHSMNRHDIGSQSDWLKLLLAILLLGFLNRAVAEDRYSAMLADGSRIAGGEIKDWHEEKKNPTLGGRAVFDEK